MVDVATVNYNSWPGFKRFIVDQSQTRVYSFINPSPYSLESPREHPNPIGLAYNLTLHIYGSVKLIKENPETIKGVKTFAGFNNEMFPERVMELASEIAYHAGVPMMLHISFAPPKIEEVLPLLQKGDILTHSFTGHTQRIVDRNGRILPEARESIDRGVLLDIGHGRGSFSFKVAKDLLGQGILPFSISTDLHGGCIHGPTYDLPTTLSKFLNLGLSLEEVIIRATTNPAKIIGGPEGLGAVKVGGVADVAVLELLKGEFEFVDAHQWILKGDKKLVATNTITRGKVMEELVKTRYPPYQEKPSTVASYTIT
jgi:dihydroorotase